MVGTAGLSNEALSVEVVDGLLVIAWHQVPTLESIAQARVVFEAQQLETASPLYLGIIEDATSFPDDAARKEFAAWLARVNFRQVLLILPHTGFRASVVRSIITSLGLLSKKSGTQKVFKSLEEALQNVGADESQALEPVARRLARIPI